VRFEDNAFRVDPAAALGVRERSFLENYERDFSWGGGERTDTENLLQMLLQP